MPLPWVRRIAVLGLVVAGAGCSRLALDPEYRGPAELPQAVAGRYAYKTSLSLAEVAGPPQEATARPAAAVAEPAAAAGDETVTVHVAVTRPPDHFDVRKFTYRPPAGASQRRPAPAVIVIPMLGGSPFVRAVSRDMCESLRSEGFAALYLDDARSPVNDHSSPGDLEDALAAGTAEIRAALDWLSQRPEIDAERIGAVGISLGGIRLAIAAAVDRRLKANFIALAGADIPDIIFGSGQARVRAYRDRLVARFGSEPAARAALSAALRTDPVHLAGHVDARRVLLVLASFDDVVPVKNGKLLYERTEIQPIGEARAEVAPPGLLRRRKGRGRGGRSLVPAARGGSGASRRPDSLGGVGANRLGGGGGTADGAMSNGRQSPAGPPPPFRFKALTG